MALALPIKKVGIGTAKLVRGGDIGGSDSGRELQSIDRDQPIRVRKRQRSKENAVYQTEDGSRCTNPKRQCEDRSHRESWTATELAHGESHVLQDGRKHG